MTLSFVDPSASPPTLNVLAYGGPGVGKTVGACSAPGPVLLLNAEGRGAARFARRHYGHDKIHEVEITGAGTLDEAYLYLRGGDAPEKTVVVDSLGAVFRVLLKDIANGGKPTLPNYGDVSTKVEDFCWALRDLPVNVVLIAHETSVKDEESGVFERLPVTGTSNPMLGVKLMALVDVVAYFAVMVPPDEKDETRYVAQLVSANGRRGKDRTGTLGKFREVDLTDWITIAAGTEAAAHDERAAAQKTSTTTRRNGRQAKKEAVPA